MGMLTDCWNWFKEPNNIATASLLIVVVFGIIGGIWEFYKYLAQKDTSGIHSGIHIEGGVKAGRDVTIQQIQTTPEQFDALLKKRLKEVMAELPTAEAEHRAVLLKELDTIKVKFDNLQKAYEEQQAKLAEAYNALEEFKKDFTPDQVKLAQQALVVGNTVDAETLFQKVLDKGTVQAAEAAYQLGILAESRIDYLKAKEYYERAVHLQPDNPRYLNALGNLQQTLGRYKEAKQHLEQALRIREKTLGPNHLDVAQSLNNLATLFLEQGKYLEAEPFLKRALMIGEQTLGHYHPHVATCLQNLAVLYLAQGNYNIAESVFQEALKIDETVLGPDHPNVATGLNNLAELFRTQGKYAEAEPLYKRAIHSRDMTLGHNHPYTAQILNNLAALYLAQDKYTEADQIFQNVIKIHCCPAR